MQHLLSFKKVTNTMLQSYDAVLRAIALCSNAVFTELFKIIDVTDYILITNLIFTKAMSIARDFV